MTDKPGTSLGHELRECIRILLGVKARLPFIEKLRSELKRMDGGANVPVRNDGVWRMALDSFDMLVIDLVSLRERMLERSQLFDRMKAEYHLFRFSPADCDDGIFLGVARNGGVSPDAAAEKFWQASMKRMLVENWSANVKKLFGGGPPVTKDAVVQLRRRFEKETKAILLDRNVVRAHRFEQPRKAKAGFYLSPEKVGKQIAVFERYLNGILGVLERASYSMHSVLGCDPQKTAEDLADLIALGSIDEALMKYSLIRPRSVEAPRSEYCARRARFYQEGGKLSGDTNP